MYIVRVVGVIREVCDSMRIVTEWNSANKDVFLNNRPVSVVQVSQWASNSWGNKVGVGFSTDLCNHIAINSKLYNSKFQKLRKGFAVQPSDRCPHIRPEFVRWDGFFVVWLPWASLLAGCCFWEGGEGKHVRLFTWALHENQRMATTQRLSGDTVACRMTADTDSE